MEPAMTTDRNKLLELAKEAGFDVDTDGDIWGSESGSLFRFAALLQAQGEPVAHVIANDDFDGIKPNDLYYKLPDGAPLYAAPPSSDQVWNGAIETIKPKLRSIAVLGKISLSWAMDELDSLKRPSQAQEPKCRACNGNDADMPCAYPGESAAGCLRDQRLAVSGAVDELPCDFDAWLTQEEAKNGCMGLSNLELDQMRLAFNAALSRAKATQPAQQAPAVSDDQILDAIDFHSGRRPDGSNAEALCQELRALLSQPAAVPVSEHAVPEGFVLVPIKPTREMVEAVANVDPERESVWDAYLSAAPSNQSQGGGK
jgi:hypothetical protein